MGCDCPYYLLEYDTAIIFESKFFLSTYFFNFLLDFYTNFYMFIGTKLCTFFTKTSFILNFKIITTITLKL